MAQRREQFRRTRSPIGWPSTITLLFALPLYLLKIEPPPRELWWTLTIFFILFIYPARLLTGWAVGRAMHHEKPRFFLFRWMAAPRRDSRSSLFYLFILFFTQYTSFLGPASILEQHAFLCRCRFWRCSFSDQLFGLLWLRFAGADFESLVAAAAGFASVLLPPFSEDDDSVLGLSASAAFL